jgi:hypothetical protein
MKRTIAAAIIGLAALGGASEAHASTVAVDATCYLSGSPITANAAGFTPNGAVNFAFDGQLASSGTADPAGNLSAPLTAPLLPTGTHQHAFSLAAQDQSNPALAATTTVNVTERVATVSPQRAKPSRKVKMSVYALNPNQPVWLHYVFHKKQRARVKLGTAHGPCGSLSARKRFFPMRHPSFGTWTFQFDNSKRYSKKTVPQIRGPVTIFRTFK